MNRPQLSPEKETLVLGQGKAYDAAVNYIKDKNRGVTVQTDDYIITVVCEAAEGMYVIDSEKNMNWQLLSPQDNQHIEVMVQDRYDHRFVPELQVYCKVSDILDNFVEEKLQRFIWHPLVFYYGENWTIPEEGDYMISLTIKSPLFRRHDHDLGNRYNKDITLELAPIHMVPGRCQDIQE